MSLDVQIALVLAAALLSGLVAGAFGAGRSDVKPGGRRGAAIWLAATGLAVLVGFGAPALGWVTGRSALWTEGAAVLLAVYVTGCGLGCLGRRAVSA